MWLHQVDYFYRKTQQRLHISQNEWAKHSNMNIWVMQFKNDWSGSSKCKKIKLHYCVIVDNLYMLSFLRGHVNQLCFVEFFFCLRSIFLNLGSKKIYQIILEMWHLIGSRTYTSFIWIVWSRFVQGLPPFVVSSGLHADRYLIGVQYPSATHSVDPQFVWSRLEYMTVILL